MNVSALLWAVLACSGLGAASALTTADYQALAVGAGAVATGGFYASTQILWGGHPWCWRGSWGTAPLPLSPPQATAWAGWCTLGTRPC
jgi:hypothetical protein